MGAKDSILSETGRPQLSIVIVPVGDTTGFDGTLDELAGNLAALRQQVDAPSHEVIVPYHRRTRGIPELKARFPEVQFLLVDPLASLSDRAGTREHHDELRARAVAVARGEIVAMLEDHVWPDRHWCARVVAAHQQPWGCVGGAIEIGINRALNWAVYFCDLGKYQNPLPAGESPFASTVNASYRRAVLDSISDVWRSAFNETYVHWALRARGQKLALDPAIVVYQHRINLRLRTVLAEFFIWGRSYGRKRTRLISARQRLVYATFSVLLPFLMCFRLARGVVRRRRTVGTFVLVSPLVLLLAASWSAGEKAGYLGGAQKQAACAAYAA